jgi:type IV secretion system protein VirD4
LDADHPENGVLIARRFTVLYAEADKTLAGVAAFLSDPRRPIETTLQAMMTTPHMSGVGTHSVVASTARDSHL